jgi:hypothetical protein
MSNLSFPFSYISLHFFTDSYISLHFETQPANNLSSKLKKQPKTQRTKTAQKPDHYKDPASETMP